MNSEIYISILQKVLSRSLDKLELIENDFMFQQDNAPCHVSKMSKKYFKEKKINVMDWMSNSPDLNLIENIWSLLKLKISKENPHNKIELIETFIKSWNDFFADPKICQNLILSMKNRIKEVINRRGDYIDY